MHDGTTTNKLASLDSAWRLTTGTDRRIHEHGNEPADCMAYVDNARLVEPTTRCAPGWSERGGPSQVVPPGRGRGDRGQVVPPAWHDHGAWMHPSIRGHGFGMMAGRDWFGGLIKLIDGLLKLAALALLIWLGFQIFRQRRNQPPATNPPTAPQPPLTPAGHNPRVE